MVIDDNWRAARAACRRSPPERSPHGRGSENDRAWHCQPSGRPRIGTPVIDGNYEHAAGGTDENHAWNAIDLTQIEDAWVRNTTLLHFGLSGVRTNTATRITVENTRSLDPVARVEGARMYNFNAYHASQNILFKNCHATNGRHHYVSNGMSTTSGIVFLHSTSAGTYSPSEGHRWWSQALLFDNHSELDGPRPGFNPRLLGLYNRGHHGTSHGWSAAHSVAWNCDVAGGDLILQKPPTAQNYAIGCRGGRISPFPLHRRLRPSVRMSRQPSF